jgi:ATP-dependent Lon protease
MPKEEELLKMDAEGANETPAAAETGGGTLARPSDVLPGLLHILPLANRPFFPAQMVPLVVDREPWQRTVEAAVESGQHVGLVLIRGDDPQTAGPDDFYTMGTASRIHKVVQMDDKLQLFVEGLQRFRIASWVTRERPFAVRAEYFPVNTIKELLPLNPLYGEELKFFLNRFGPDDPSPSRISPPASPPPPRRSCRRCWKRRRSWSAWRRCWC